MKTKQKSFIANSSKKLSTYRPNSSTKNSRLLRQNKNNSLSDFYPPITLTMPSQKKSTRLGNQITKEQLYDENLYLKDKLNKMKKDLDETKSKLFQKGLELNKKEKIIRDCSKENVTEYTHEINLEKAKESALLTMCKNKYNEMKKLYQKKCEENNILKTNIKITKIKEYQIQIDILKKEMEKIRNLYLNSQSNYEKSLKEIKKMEDLKKEFLQQHTIIDSINKKYQDLSDEMNYIKKENAFLKNELNKNQEIQKKLKKNNLKLKMSNEKYMNLKKQKESSIITNKDNIRQLKNLKKDLAEYKLLNLKLNEQYQNLIKNKKIISNTNILGLKPTNYENAKQVIINQSEQNQSQLYKSLLQEAKLKNSILESFLREHDINPEQIIKNKGYEGIINLNTNKNVVKLTQKLSKNSTNNNSTNTKDATSVGTKENTDLSKNLNNTQSNFENNFINNKTDININKNNNIINNEINNDMNSEIINNNNIIDVNNININDIKEDKKEELKIDNNIKEKDNQDEIKDNNDNEENKENNQLTEKQDTMKITQSQNSEYNIQEQQAKETQLLAILHTFVKNIEANHITKETLINKIKEISLLFENKEEAAKEEFIEPFINLFIESMKVTQSSDIQLINEFFNNFIDDMEGDTNRFFLELIDIFENIVDYTLVENEEEVLNAISMELQPYKEELKLKLEKNENNIITFDNLRQIIEELNISLSDDYTEFLIYKMKEKVPENSSIFDLNYKIILDLLDRNTNNINNNVENNVENNIENNVNKEQEEKNIKEEEKENGNENENENESKDNYDEDEMNIQMSNKLTELKQALKINNTNLEEECKDNITVIEDENNKKINGINKDIFFGLMEKYNIEIEEKVKEAIFDLFKIENDILVKSESELFLLDFDKLCSILEFEPK